MEASGRKRGADDSSDDVLVASLSKKAKPGEGPTVDLTLFVRWFSMNGRTKVNQLLLRPLASLDSLQGLSKALLSRIYPQPEHILSNDFHQFTHDEFLSVPSDLARTVFRLAASYEGWEYTIFECEHAAQRDPDQKMLVTVVEFESSPVVVGHLGLRISLVAYPVISVHKQFLANIESEMRTNPNFKGLLTRW